MSKAVSALVREPGFNSVCARPHLTRFLRIRIVPGFSQPTYVCGLKVGRNLASYPGARGQEISARLVSTACACAKNPFILL